MLKVLTGRDSNFKSWNLSFPLTQAYFYMLICEAELTKFTLIIDEACINTVKTY